MSDNLLNKLTQLKLPAMTGSLIRQRELMRELLNGHCQRHDFLPLWDAGDFLDSQEMKYVY
ncbi:hypothetical protein HEM55_024410 [Escherichia coli]|nr:hypothetical protein [Escherichia coli]